MNGMTLLQTLFAGQLDTKDSIGAIQGTEKKAFLDALLETDALRDSGLTIDDLEAWLAEGGGKSLPVAAAFMPSDVESVGDGSERHLDAPPPEDLLAADLRAGLAKDAVRPSGGGLLEQRPTGAELSGQQLAARLALLDQLQMRRALDSQDGRQVATRLDGDGASSAANLLSYAQTSQLVDTAPRPTPMPTFVLGTPMDQGGWGQAMGERLLMMAKDGVQQARLQINPRELGPVDVSITTRDDKTTIHFVAQHAVTREALESELPRLRMMMQENGFEELDVNVGRDEGRDFAGRDPDDDREADGAGGRGADAGEPWGEERDGSPRPRGLVDHYA